MRTFRLIDQERQHHAVSLLCAVLKVTRQGFYAWKRRQLEPGPRRRQDQRLQAAILRVYARSRETYGAPRITARLRIDEQIRIGQRRTTRLMRELQIQRRIARQAPAAYHRPGSVIGAGADDRLDRDFTACRPDEKWCADITYIETREGYLFLAVVTDVFSRRIVGWSMRDNLEAELVADAVAMSVARRRPGPGMIHHSDRGSQGGFN